MTTTRVRVGERIYYTGDQANQDGFGKVVKLDEGGWGESALVVLDDGRAWWVEPNTIGRTYDGTCYPRFVTVAAFETWRKARIDSFRA